MAKLTSLELWRLADTLSVINASILIAGGDPSEHAWDENDERVQQTWQHDGYEAAFSALRGAILTNKLAANVTHAMRAGRVGYGYGDETPYEIFAQPNEEQISYDMLIARIGDGGYKAAGKTSLNFSVDSLRSERFLYICKEPNWEQTSVDVEHLKKWLKGRGVFPDFFFPEGNIEGFRNPENQRYAPKLACAVAAWEATPKRARNKSVKQTLQDWIQSNGVKFGVGESGVVSPTAAEEIAKIANWNTKGGATATTTEADEVETPNDTEQPINNYGYGYLEKDDTEDDLPF